MTAIGAAQDSPRGREDQTKAPPLVTFVTMMGRMGLKGSDKQPLLVRCFLRVALPASSHTSSYRAVTPVPGRARMDTRALMLTKRCVADPSPSESTQAFLFHDCKRLRAPPQQPGRPQDRKGGKRVSAKKGGCGVVGRLKGLGV